MKQCERRALPGNAPRCQIAVFEFSLALEVFPIVTPIYYIFVFKACFWISVRSNVASAAHLSQKNFKDFRKASIIFAQFDHFGFRSNVARVTSCNTVQSKISTSHHQQSSTSINQAEMFVSSFPTGIAAPSTSIRPKDFATSTRGFRKFPSSIPPQTQTTLDHMLGLLRLLRVMLQSTLIYHFRHFRFQIQLPTEKNAAISLPRFWGCTWPRASPNPLPPGWSAPKHRRSTARRRCLGDMRHLKCTKYIL